MELNNSLCLDIHSFTEQCLMKSSVSTLENNSLSADDSISVMDYLFHITIIRLGFLASPHSVN